jgi:hypothetical protein
MTHTDGARVYTPPISPLRRAMNILTSRGQLSPGMRDILLNGSALDTEDDESLPTTHLSPLSPSRQRAGSGSGGSSPGLGLASLGRKAVSLVRSRSSSWRATNGTGGGILKRQQSQKTRHGRSLSEAIPRSRTWKAARPPGLLLSSPGVPISITTPSPSRDPLPSPHRALTPLPALTISLASFPPSSSPVSMPSASPLTGEDHTRGVSVAQSASPADVTVPDLLQRGTPMIKVSGRKQTNVVCKLDPDQGQIIWESKKHRISSSFIDIPDLPSLLIHPIFYSTHREYQRASYDFRCSILQRAVPDLPRMRESMAYCNIHP